ncbi:HTH domain-containing protein [Listeria sp. FSL L7-1582]|uniref:helix-turn-helix domain-containing protein n=1 Tax=Listeria portnoyi TaxID=2713504 RepID=UPI00164D2070|nr:helix-turn-helix domain-containing protein [Listeria portnoyi]MBC6308609.1 HTH domain-containing protein [Listeria portnoyi]
MKNLIVASEYRKLHLLQTLFEAPQNYQKKELANILDCSIKTLERDILSLQELLDSDVAHVYEDSSKNILLDVGEQVNFSYLYALVVSNSHLYLLAKDIFTGQKMSLAEWANEHYTSLPTMYRRVRQIDTYLAESNLILETQPLAIKGSEINLRFFYYQIYSKSYPYTEWPFPDIPYEIVNQFILQVEAFYHIRFSLSSRIQYAISIAVSLIRMQQGNTHTFQEHWLQTWDAFAASQPEGISIDYSILEQLIGMPLSRSERFFTLASTFWSHFTHTDDFFLTARATFSPSTYVPKYTLASELTSILAEYPSTERDFAITETIDFLSCFTFIDNINILPDIPLPQVPLEKATLADQIHKILTKYESHPDFRFIRQNKLVITNHLTDIYSILTQQTQHYDTLHIKVISKKGYLWENYLRGEIERKYSKNQIRICNDMTMNEQHSNIDLIISDFPFYEQTEIQADGLLWNIPPSLTDFAQLDSILERQRA